MALNRRFKSTSIDWLIIVIFLSAFFIRLIYIFQVMRFPLTELFIQSHVFDQYGFNERALYIARDSWLGGSEVFGKEPLYSYFLASIYKIFGYSHITVYLMQSLLTSVGVILLYKITSTIFNKFMGYIASFILALYSISIFYDTQLLRASLLTFLNILLFYLLVRAYRYKRTFLWFTAGLVLGLSVLTRHNILFPFIILFVLFTIRPFKIAFKSALIFTIGAVIVLSPVLMRNYIVSDYKKICISSEVNAFWVGNIYNSSGIDFEPDLLEYRNLVFKSGGGIIKTAQLFLNEIKKRPKEYLKLYSRKIWMFFNSYEAPSNTNFYLYREEFPTVLRLPLFNFQLICALGILGVLLSVFRQEKPYLAYIFILTLSGSVILFHIQSRFRLPAVPFFIIFCSYTIYYIFDKIKNGDFRKAMIIIILSISFYIILRPDLTYAGFRNRGGKIRPLDMTNMALAYLDYYKKYKDDSIFKRVLMHCNLAIEKERTDYIPYRIKGYMYLLEKRFRDSIEEYKRALIYDSRNPFLYNELAGVYYSQGSYRDAFVNIKRALRLFPGNKIFENNLDIILLSQT